MNCVGNRTVRARTVVAICFPSFSNPDAKAYPQFLTCHPSSSHPKNTVLKSSYRWEKNMVGIQCRNYWSIRSVLGTGWTQTSNVVFSFLFTVSGDIYSVFRSIGCIPGIFGYVYTVRHSNSDTRLQITSPRCERTDSQNWPQRFFVLLLKENSEQKKLDCEGTLWTQEPRRTVLQLGQWHNIENSTAQDWREIHLR